MCFEPILKPRKIEVDFDIALYIHLATQVMSSLYPRESIRMLIILVVLSRFCDSRQVMHVQMFWMRFSSGNLDHLVLPSITSLGCSRIPR